MENNIFIKMKREKHNPDIENKLKGKEDERTSTQFNLSTLIYNPITGVIPAQIRSNNDLVLQKDMSFSSTDIKKLIMEKENERVTQDTQFKPVKTKVINNNPQGQGIVNNNTPDNCQQVSRTNYIETYEELKRGSTNNKNEQNKSIYQNKEKYNNILDGLKDLGIIK